MISHYRYGYATLCLISVLYLLSVCSCSLSKERRELEAKHEVMQKAFMTENDSVKKEALLVELLNIEVMGLGSIDRAMTHYKENESLLEESVMGRCLVAVAQAMKANEVKEIRDKLKWLSTSSDHFEELHRKWPDNTTVHVYHASTLASLPPEVGAEDETMMLVDQLVKQGEMNGASYLEDYQSQIGYIIDKLSKSPNDEDGARRLANIEERYRKLFGIEGTEEKEDRHE